MSSLRRRSIGVLLVAATATATLTAGCAAPNTGGLDAPDSPVARYDWDPRRGGDDALLEGTLAPIDGCLMIVDSADGSGPGTVPVFTRELTSWDADAQVLTYAGDEFALGDRVAAGGGWGPPTEDMTIPDACVPDEWGDVMHVQDTSLRPLEARDL